MLYCARKVLDFLKLPEAARQISELQRGIGGGREDGSGDHRGDAGLIYLPPADEVVTDFVGREKELTRLRAWLMDPHAARWALAGDGGKGKSAIAYSFARDTAHRCPPGMDAVIWLSAKIRRFVQGQTLNVDRPDFRDLPSALAAIVEAYGFDPASGKEEAILQALDLLREFPALLVIDDIDTLEGEAVAASQFLIMDVPAKTRSRVLVTSRRVLFGLENCTTVVEGMSESDTRNFVTSRCDLMNINQVSVLRHAAAIREVTDASPLYIEDLLRLTLAGVGIDQAIGLWRDRRGTAAREYAIRREFDQLPEDAKEVLLALTLVDRPCGMDEVRTVLNWNIDRLIDAQQSLRQMYLLRRTDQPDGAATLLLNGNMKTLVTSVFQGSAVHTKMKRVVHAVQGRLETGLREDVTVGRVLRQVRSQVSLLERRLDKDQNAFKTALHTLEELKSQFPARGDVHSVLGWVHKRAGRWTDAREEFKRAIDLGAKDPELYFHWAELELDVQEWQAAMRVAEEGRQCFPTHASLLFVLGYAQSRAGQQALRDGSLPEAKAKELCTKAEQSLQAATDSGRCTRSQSFRAYRALVLNADALGNGKAVGRHLSEWIKRCGDSDPWKYEYGRMRLRYPGDVARQDCL